MDTYKSEKYYCTLDNLDEVLNKYGVAIIPNLLDDIETKKIQDGMWETLEYLTKGTDFEILKISEYTNENYLSFYEHLDSKNGFLKYRWGDHAVRVLYNNLFIKQEQIIYYNG